MLLNIQQKKQLKAKAHSLKPLVYIGLNGFTDNVKNEIDRCLTDHELIKIRIQENDRDIRRELYQTICTAVSAGAVQLIGSVGILYRKNPEKIKVHKNPSTKAKAKLMKKNKKKPAR